MTGALWQQLMLWARSRPKRAVFLCMGLVALLFMLSAPGNLSETDDVYAFAHRAEQFSYSHVSDPRLMLYHMGMRGLYVGVNAVLPEPLQVRALPLMRGVSAICGSLALWLCFTVMRKVVNASAGPALITTALLGLSYGFWRYAAEAEVYVPAIAACLALLLGLNRWLQVKKAWWSVWPLGLAAGASILMYQPAVIPLLIVFPLMLWRHKLAACAYGFTASFCVILGYLWGFSLFWSEALSVENLLAFVAQRSEEFVVPPLSLRTVVVSMLQAAFALSHDLVSLNALFALQTVQEWVARLFPFHVIREEVFMTRHLGWQLWVLGLNALLLAYCVLRLVYQRLRLGVTFTRDLKQAMLLLWLLVNGAIIGRLNPAGIEAWIMILPPLCLLLGAFVIAPLWSAEQRTMKYLLGSLLVHNLVGGMGLVYSEHNEYHTVIASKVLKQASHKDLVLISGDAGLVEALRYLGRATPIHVAAGDKIAIANALLNNAVSSLQARTLGRDFRDQSVAEHIRRAFEQGGYIYLFEDFFYGDLPSAESPLLLLRRAAISIDQRVDGAHLYRLSKQSLSLRWREHAGDDARP